MLRLMMHRMRTSWGAVALAAVLLLVPPARGQDAEPPKDEKPAPARQPYAGSAKELAGRYEHVQLRQIGLSRGERPLRLLTVLPRSEGAVVALEETTWSALLVAHLSGLRSADETRLALDIAARLAEEDAASYPAGAAFHVLLDANPDATAAADRGLPRAGNDHPVDEDADGEIDEDPPEDLDGDGRISWMRFPDPAGQLSDTREGDAAAAPAAPVFAAPEKGRPRTHRVVREGRDGDDDGAANEDGPGGVDLNRNFTVSFEEHSRGAGDWPISEPESRALMDLVVADERIGLVYELGAAETLAKRPAWTAAWPKLPEADQALYDGLRELHGPGAEVRRKEYAPGPGSLGVTVVHQLERIWVGRAPLGRAGPVWPARGARWPDHLVLRWRPVSGTGVPHGAELGDVALAPGRTAPKVRAETESAAAFLLSCARERARLEFVETTSYVIEGVLGITTRIVNRGRLPTHTRRGADLREGRRPVNIRVRLPLGARVMAGKPLVQIERLGPGERSDELRFVVRGPSGTKVVVEASAPDAGMVTLEREIK